MKINSFTRENNSERQAISIVVKYGFYNYY